MLSSINALLLKLLGWKVIVEGNLDELKKYIVVVVPHTSNWDFPLGLMVRSSIRQDIKFVGKRSLFKPPHGAVFRWLGGIPVDRSKSNNTVDATIDMFNNRSELAICIAPEGTRKKVDRLKSGFYYIARGANVAIVLCKFDFENKEVVFREPFYTTDDKEADMALIHDYFKNVRGKIPKNSFGVDW